ncbi:hypothetical protein NNJEOMEG_02281 [Fundidesulfovibrio magnetotacticus]|uniref:Uncharacterized protein n=2 Tax=Fundidesulfovibrio magnetotacticus TaxID=2730080 RepID=A0A6V8LXA5_9BACT|nr:hypothetical protein NNJEOMEG_02281 [Fundidesulfovibrio magnetotacticus]
MQALARIEDKLDTLDVRLDGMERRAMTAGAVAGGISGGLVGGVVTTAVLYIKAKFLGW